MLDSAYEGNLRGNSNHNQVKSSFSKETDAVGDGFHPIICMYDQKVAKRRSVRNQSQRLHQQHDTIKKKLG